MRRTWRTHLAVNSLYDSLSYCASLHPSAGIVDEEGLNNHPLAGLANLTSEFDDHDDNDNYDRSADNQKCVGGRVRSEVQSPDARYRPY